MDLKLFPPEELSEGLTINLPLSKSESNRQLIIAALTPQGKHPSPVADCDDTDAMLNALSATSGTVNIGAAGTAMRFLTAFYACQPGVNITLDGSERMRQRPIGPLVEALRAAGADIEYAGIEGFPPLHIRGRQLEGGEVTIDANISSQYISAILMVAPTMTHGLQLHLRGQVASTPYIHMTLQLMAAAGIEANFDTDRGIVSIPHGTYRPGMPPIEADWSAASYWFAIAAIGAETISLTGLRPKSLQGDSAIEQYFRVTGLRSSLSSEGTFTLTLTPDAGSQLNLDMSATPDLVQTLAVTCCLLYIPFRFSGCESLRIKETDRMAALQMELSKLGYIIEIQEPDTILWRGARFEPDEQIEPINTYDDHRMAMAFAPAAFYFPGLQINNAQVVTKSYPNFWSDLTKVGFTLQEVTHD